MNAIARTTTSRATNKCARARLAWANAAALVRARSEWLSRIVHLEEVIAAARELVERRGWAALVTNLEAVASPG
jgi:hypothetical protein